MEHLRIQEDVVKQAVEGLKVLNKKYLEKVTKKKLLNDESKPAVFLQVTLKKIPYLSNIKMLKISLPHSLLEETSEICLITGDLDKKDKRADSELTVAHYRDILYSHGIKNIKEILSLRQVRTEYKSFEARRQLYAAYDFFLADSKITKFLPTALGKHFFKKRKFPFPINMNAPKLQDHLDKALRTTVMYITGHGNSTVVEVGSLGFETENIVENVLAAIKVIAEKIDGTWQNINSISLKTVKSLSFPLYVSYKSAKDVKLKEMEFPKPMEDEISSLVNSKIKLYRDGNIRVERVDSDEEESECEFERDILEGDGEDDDQLIMKNEKVEIYAYKNKNKKRKMPDSEGKVPRSMEKKFKTDKSKE